MLFEVNSEERGVTYECRKLNWKIRERKYGR